MSGNVRKSKKVLVASHLAGGWNNAQAAEKCGVSERTVYRYLDDPDFCKMLREFQDEAVAEALGKFKSLGHQAVQVIHDQLRCGWDWQTPGQAARFVLSTLVRMDANTRERKELKQQTEILGQQVQSLEKKNTLLEEEIERLRRGLQGDVDDGKEPAGKDPKAA